MKKIELLPCPFCGGEAVVNVKNGVKVICTKCRIMTYALTDIVNGTKIEYGAIKNVVDTWNQRINKDGG